ncbi:hypothetical protein [Eggerthia catenaformis]|uniref:hypothetical protein n=1 Tax=Eggerthia catenaformis TaxID=31973 RepID=UPI00055125A3|nr:hypothetical protein [Eggerthia catenaformis]
MKKIILLFLIGSLFGCISEKKPDLSIYQKGLQEYKSYSIDIPGLNTSFVPQGLTMMDDYFIVSSYDKNKIKNSTLYMIHKDTKKVIEISLYNKCHAGGISYNKDKKELYIADSSQHCIQIISRQRLLKGLNTHHVHYDSLLKTQVKPSFLAYDKGYIYVGKYSEKRYEDLEIISTKNKSSSLIKGFLPYYTQGIVFASRHHKDYILYSSSNDSRKQDYSRLYINQIDRRTMKSLKKRAFIDIYQCSENMYVDEDKLYIIYESGAKSYRFLKNVKATDKILAGKLSDYLEYYNYL